MIVELCGVFNGHTVDVFAGPEFSGWRDFRDGSTATRGSTKWIVTAFMSSKERPWRRCGCPFR